MPVSREGGYACRACGKVYRKRRSLSRRGYCPNGCGEEAMIRAVLELHYGTGPTYERWRERTLRGLGVGVSPPPPAADHAAEA